MNEVLEEITQSLPQIPPTCPICEESLTLNYPFELVKNNFEPVEEPVIKITASGHGYMSDGKQLQREATTLIERFYGNIIW